MIIKDFFIFLAFFYFEILRDRGVFVNKKNYNNLYNKYDFLLKH